MATDDIVLAAYRDDGRWELVELRPAVLDDAAALADALGRFPSDVGVLGLVAGDDGFLVLRRIGDSVRVLLSDASLVATWSIAEDVAEAHRLPGPEQEDEVEPVGALDIVSDLGLSADDVLRLCLDDELWPEEVLAEVAERLGFGDEFETIVG